jgi:hypothetical protein
VWKVFYVISYYDCDWNEIKLMAKTGLDAFAVMGAVCEFTHLWARLERGQPVEIPGSNVPIAFTIEVYHVESQENEVVAAERLCPGHTPGCDSSASERSGSGDDVSGLVGVYDAEIRRQDADKAGSQVDHQSGGGALDRGDRHANGDNPGTDSVCLTNDSACGLQSSNPRKTNSLDAWLDEEQKKVADH